MIKIQAYFNGKNGSLGLVKGNLYELVIQKNNVSILIPRNINPVHCPYESVESFLNNWELTTKPDLRPAQKAVRSNLKNPGDCSRIRISNAAGV